MCGQQLARLELQLLGIARQLAEVTHPACPAADLDDVAAPHGGRGDLDGGWQRSPGRLSPHRCTSPGADSANVE
ncbi:hypothetical protein [Streptomyces sp. NPDC052042]|uniref:hypothetical protein n=1 Tax=Streptomyces sp. NPDC052042 TaxID=3365683 RepID=UPI0037D6A70D